MNWCQLKRDYSVQYVATKHFLKQFEHQILSEYDTGLGPDTHYHKTAACEDHGFIVSTEEVGSDHVHPEWSAISYRRR